MSVDGHRRFEGLWKSLTLDSPAWSNKPGSARFGVRMTRAELKQALALHAATHGGQNPRADLEDF